MLCESITPANVNLFFFYNRFQLLTLPTFLCDRDHLRHRALQKEISNTVRLHLSRIIAFEPRGESDF